MESDVWSRSTPEAVIINVGKSQPCINKHQRLMQTHRHIFFLISLHPARLFASLNGRVSVYIFPQLMRCHCSCYPPFAPLSSFSRKPSVKSNFELAFAFACVHGNGDSYVFLAVSRRRRHRKYTTTFFILHPPLMRKVNIAQYHGFMRISEVKSTLTFELQRIASRRVCLCAVAILRASTKSEIAFSPPPLPPLSPLPSLSTTFRRSACAGLGWAVLCLSLP